MPPADQPVDAASLGLLETHLIDLRTRLDRAQGPTGSGDREVLVADLETAYEELRVAEEEVRSQQEQIAHLLEGRTLLRWQQERMMASLPVPTLTADQHGIIRAVNAAAAGLMKMPVSRLLGKPVLTLFAAEDRVALRGLISAQVRDGESFQRRVTAQPRDGSGREVVATAAVLPGLGPDVTWMLLEEVGGSAPPSGAEAIPAVLARLAAVPAAAADRHEVLATAVELCRAGFGAGVQVTITVGAPTDPSALTSTSQLAQAMDGAQVTSGEGPCVTAYETGSTVRTPDVRSDSRWPGLSDLVPAEIGAVVAAPLQVGEQRVGALNLYFVDRDVLDADVATAELLAATIASVLYEFGLKDELRVIASDMERALASRAVIDQAKGIVMADRSCTADEAFQHLVQLSSSRQLKLRDVARMLVEQRSGTAPSG